MRCDGRFLSYQQTEADTYHKIKATLWEDQTMVDLAEPEAVTAAGDEFMPAINSRPGMEVSIALSPSLINN